MLTSIKVDVDVECMIASLRRRSLACHAYKPKSVYCNFLGQLCPREKAQRGLWNPCKAPTLTGQTTTPENPLLFSNSDDAGDEAYGLSSLSKKTIKSHLMQIS